MRTIPRSHKAKVAEVREKFTKCVLKSLDANFEAIECTPDAAWSRFDSNPRVKLVERKAGEEYRIEVHSNHWYVLTLPKAKEEK